MAMRSVTTSGQLGRDPLFRLFQHFEGLEEAWWTSSVNFEGQQRAFTVEGTRWKMFFHVYAARLRSKSASKVEFKSTITLWPTGLTKNKEARLRKSKWPERCQRQMRRHGYRGKWDQSPHGPFALFEKTLRDVKAVTAEVVLLDELRLWERVTE